MGDGRPRAVYADTRGRLRFYVWTPSMSHKAIQLRRDNVTEVAAFVGQPFKDRTYADIPIRCLVISTPKRDLFIREGDWVVDGGAGFYVASEAPL